MSREIEAKPRRKLAGRPRLDDVTDRRETILRAAIELVADQGFEAVTYKSIAQQAGVAHSLISHYFGDRAAYHGLDCIQCPLAQPHALRDRPLSPGREHITCCRESRLGAQRLLAAAHSSFRIFTFGQRVALERPGIVAISGPQKWTAIGTILFLKRTLFLVRI